ncbi:MAG: hypothetical protein GYA23_01390, partial [Methanomicrobiales archaeon]|nr:hypothetical protein [Methanomicrobiales archaeon]
AATFLFVTMIFALLLSALIHAFVFVINWEDWFFGTRLAGEPAGIFLFGKAAGAAGILVIMAQYPRFQRAGAVLCAGYFGVLFFNSLLTVNAITAMGTQALFPTLPATLFVLAVLLLAAIVILPPGSGRQELDTTEEV